MKNEDLENLILTEKIEGKKSRGKRRIIWMSDLTNWPKERGFKHQKVKLLQKIKNRELYQDMIAYVLHSGYST